MNNAEIDDFVSAYVASARTRDSKRRESQFWTFDIFANASLEDPDLCWTMILAVLARDQSDEVLSSIAAGPMEELLAEHGPRMLPLVEAKWRQDAIFRRMLHGVWRHGMKQEVWARVQALNEKAR